MAKYVLTPGVDRIDATGATNLIVAGSATLSTGDVIVAAAGSRTALLLQDGNQFDLAAPQVLQGVSAVLDRSVGNSVITLRAGLDLTLQLGRDNATVYGAANADRILGGQLGGYATVYLGSGEESFIAGDAGATVYMPAADAAARIEGGGRTDVTLTGAYGDAVKLGANIEGVWELDIASGGLRVSTRGAGIAAVGLLASGIAVSVGDRTRVVTDYAGGNTVQFTARDQTLVLPEAGLDPGLPADRLIGFAAGDAIDIDLPYGPDETLDYDPRTGELTLTDLRSGAAETVMLTPGPARFTLSPDRGLPNGDTGTLITLTGASASGGGQAPCFAAGTRVLSLRGWVAVQDLVVGDELVTLSGQTRPLRWIGRRGLECMRHRQPALVQPIRVMAGAFAPDLPQCDVVLSPDHGVFIEGALIPVKCLVNGATVVQEAVERVTYFHLELDRHDVVLAEGLPVESYLDTGNRRLFDNGGGAVALHPDFGAGRPAEGCAAVVTGGAAVLGARGRLLARADVLGFRMTHDADLHVLADGQRIWGRLAEGVWGGWVPPGVKSLVVASRASAPADCELGSEDMRRLGVALRGVTVLAPGAGRRLGPDGMGWGAGFYAPEADAWAQWRWTDGQGRLEPWLWAGIGAAFRLELHVFRTLAYRVAAEPGEVRLRA